MKTNQEDKSLSFVKRWVKAFNRILRLFGDKQIPNNAEFVDSLLREEEQNAKTQEDLDILAKKRNLLEELCDDVDTYYRKKAEAKQASDLNKWFDNEVRTFVYDTMLDATEEDVKEVEKEIEESMMNEINTRASLLEDEFSGTDEKTLKPEGNE